MSKPGEAIGTCPCPVTGCGQVADVLRFAERAKSDRQRRFAGKLFLRCPEHGRLGIDGRSGMQEFILGSATIWREGQKPGSEPAAAVAAPAPEAAKPALAPVKPPRGAAPKPPAAKPAPEPAPAPRPKSSGLLL